MDKNLKVIMLVEDEPDIQEVARLSLESFGNFNVHVCSSGKEAISKAPILMPDLIMLDVMMPGMDGLTTLKLLKEDPKVTQIPEIFMTAKAQVNEMKHYVEIGAIGAISTPFDPMKLATQVNEIWHKHHE